MLSLKTWHLKKLMNVYNKINRLRYRKQTSGYQWGEGSGKGHNRGRGLRDTNYYV